VVQLLAAGEAAASAGDFGAASDAFRRATTLDPDHPIAYFQLAICLEKMGLAGAAERAFMQAGAAIRRGETSRLEAALEGYRPDELLSVSALRLEDGVVNPVRRAQAAPMASVLEVRTAGELQALPGRREGIAGLVEKDGQVLTVLSTLGAGGAHVLLLSSAKGSFGLLTDEVLGVVDVTESEIQPPPLGQSRELVSGAINTRGRLELMVSVVAL
jgi:chemotaxis signal transduction protein